MQSHIERNFSLGYSLKILDISASTPTEKKKKKKKRRKVEARWTQSSHKVITIGNISTLQRTTISAMGKSESLRTRSYLVTRWFPRIKSKELLKYLP